MSRTSTFMAIALSVTAIASATTPAAAVSTSIQSSLEAHHVLTPVSPPPPQRVTPGNLPGNSKVGSTIYPIQKYRSLSAVLRNAEIPVAQLPTSQCGADADIPALAAGIDQLLPTAQLSEADIAKVTELRQMIQDLSTSGKLDAARNVEEAAMYYLGYQKIWLKCGLGTFAWAQTPGNDAGQSTTQSMAQSK
jgi:hypothetical protein